MSLIEIDKLLEELYDDINEISINNTEKNRNSELDEIYDFYENKIHETPLKVITKDLKKNNKKIITKWPWSLTKKKEIVNPNINFPFRIRAISNFLCENETYLNFRKNQEFYVLKENKDRGVYYVSTCMFLPFSSSSISGLVPSIFFERVINETQSQT